MFKFISRLFNRGTVPADPAGPFPFTVVRDWDGDHGDRTPPVYHVWAMDRMTAFTAAEDLSFEEFGDDAEHLYGVTILHGHAQEA
ncbi:hypothetical protein [Streptomyces wuyuanensis]|uniref:hypothetical protein n=1 Tax=Streptomyces wuyuanensis TaxID=1196353 RepID=UPI003424D0C3